MSIPIAQSLIGYTHSICHFSFWQQVGCIKKNQFNRYKEENPDHSCSVFLVRFAGTFILASDREKIPEFGYELHGFSPRTIFWLL